MVKSLSNDWCGLRVNNQLQGSHSMDTGQLGLLAAAALSAMQNLLNSQTWDAPVWNILLSPTTA